MDTPTPSLRDQGLQALREGNLDRAVDLLARAVMADDQDAEAKALLGIAYSQKGIHAQARRALQTAVELQPQNQNYRFNLGIVLERAGDVPAAAAAYRDLLQLNPQHAQARAKLQAMGPQAHAAQAGASRPAEPAPPTYSPPSPPSYSPPPSPPIGGPPIGGPPSGTPPIGGPPSGTPPIGGPPIGGAPSGYQASAPPSAGHGAPGSYMGGPSMQGPPGTVECPGCHKFPRIGMICEFCQHPLPPPSKPAAAAPPMGGGYAPAGPPRYAAAAEDGFDVGQGFRDWFQALVAPREFFSGQVGATGLAAPISYLLAFTILAVVGSLPGILMSGRLAAMPGGYALGVIMGLVCGSICGWIGYMLGMFVWSGVVHLICLIFGARGGYAGTFRAATYALAPMAIAGILANLVNAATAPPRPPTPRGTAVQTAAPLGAAPRHRLAAAMQTFPGQPGTPRGTRPAPPDLSQLTASSPIGSAIAFVGLAFYFTWLGIGVAHIHELGTGRAVGVAILSGLIVVILLVLFILFIAAAIAAMIVGAAAAGGAMR